MNELNSQIRGVIDR